MQDIKMIQTKIIALLLLTTLTFFMGCGNEPTAPKSDNPFDIKNPDTGGDPFELSAKIAGGGVKLEWNIPDYKELQSFKIYRSESPGSGYSNMQIIEKTETTYIDTTVINGHSYWYLITAIDNKNAETRRTNAAAININTEPVFSIICILL